MWHIFWRGYSRLRSVGAHARTQNRCQIECQKCQIECQGICQIECQDICQKECQIERQILYPRYVRNYVRIIVRVGITRSNVIV